MVRDITTFHQAFHHHYFTTLKILNTLTLQAVVPNTNFNLRSPPELNACVQVSIPSQELEITGLLFATQWTRSVLVHLRAQDK